MRKGFLLIGAAIAVVLVMTIFVQSALTPDADMVSAFIRDNPTRVSFHCTHNDSVLASVSADAPMPLAQVMTLLIAIEYAEQVAAGSIKPDDRISLQDLNRFYLPNTDGDAHPQWIKHLETKGFLADGTAPLEQVVKGMIDFNSNANAEYLMMRLGVENLNRRTAALGLTTHEPIYPAFVSALFVLQNPAKRPEAEHLAAMTAMPLETYRRIATEFHVKLSTETDSALNRSFTLFDLTTDFQTLWTERLPKASARDYAALMQKLNSRKFFSEPVQARLDAVLEGVLENEEPKAWLLHAGMKGGVTPSALTHVFYARDKAGNTTELALFFTGLGVFERARLQNNLNPFELLLLRDASYRKALPAMLGEGKP